MNPPPKRVVRKRKVPRKPKSRLPCPFRAVLPLASSSSAEFIKTRAKALILRQPSRATLTRHPPTRTRLIRHPPFRGTRVEAIRLSRPVHPLPRHLRHRCRWKTTVPRTTVGMALDSRFRPGIFTAKIVLELPATDRSCQTLALLKNTPCWRPATATLKVLRRRADSGHTTRAALLLHSLVCRALLLWPSLEINPSRAAITTEAFPDRKAWTWRLHPKVLVPVIHLGDTKVVATTNHLLDSTHPTLRRGDRVLPARRRAQAATRADRLLMASIEEARQVQLRLIRGLPHATHP